MLKKIVFVILVLSICNSANAWEQLQGTGISYDKDSVEISKDKKSVDVWVKFTFANTHDDGAKSAKGLLTISCESKNIVGFHLKTYSGAMAEGSVISDVGYARFWNGDPDESWSSVYNELNKKYCKSWWKRW
jgi:hypothetical protein